MIEGSCFLYAVTKGPHEGKLPAKHLPSCLCGVPVSPWGCHRWQRWQHTPARRSGGGEERRELIPRPEQRKRNIYTAHKSWSQVCPACSGGLLNFETWTWSRHEIWKGAPSATLASPATVSPHFHLGRDTRQFLQLLPGIALLTKLLTWKSGRFQNQRACGHGNQENVFMSTGLCPYGNNSVWRLILIHFLRGTFISAQLPSALCAIRPPCIRSHSISLMRDGEEQSFVGVAQNTHAHVHLSDSKIT